MNGVIAEGIVLPYLKYGDDLLKSIVNSINKQTVIEEKDIICITESLVARLTNNYVTVDQTADNIRKTCEIKFEFEKCSNVLLTNVIYSRNRFGLILKAIARAIEDNMLNIMLPPFDPVGNRIVNQITRVNIKDYYRRIVESEGKKVTFWHTTDLRQLLDFETMTTRDLNGFNIIDCDLHHHDSEFVTLRDFCNIPTIDCGYNTTWGLLGCNKAGEDLIKLFPRVKDCKKLGQELQKIYPGCEIIIYGDGCYKDPFSEIWEFADPVASVWNTPELDKFPKEMKLKYLIDNSESFEDVDRHIKEHKEENRMGTTPRIIKNLVASLADLISGSGDRGTPVVVIKNYLR